MTIEQFQGEIKHLDQAQVLTGSISSLNKLLVDKGFIQVEELQEYFLDWMREKKLTKRKIKAERSR